MQDLWGKIPRGHHPKTSLHVVWAMIYGQWARAMLTPNERASYWSYGDCRVTICVEVMHWSPQSRAGRHPHTLAEQLEQLLRTQGTPVVKHKSPNIDGSLFPSSLYFHLWTPFLPCQAHYWISATQRCCRGKRSSPCSQSSRASSIAILVQRTDCI